MKTNVGLSIVFLVLLSCISSFGTPAPKVVSSNYVVIGAFAIENHASQWVENAKKFNFKAISAINPKRNLFYVYVLITDNRTVAFAEANKIRKGTPYFDTWVYTGILGLDSDDKGSDINPVNEKNLEQVKVHDELVAVKNDAPVTPVTSTAPTSDSVTAVREIIKPIDEAEEGSKNFLFKIYSSTDEKSIDGDVDVFDLEKTRKVATYAGNKNVAVRGANKSGDLRLVCEVFGYRKIQTDMNFNRPQEIPGSVSVPEGSQTVVPFALTRLKKGDIAVMYNVYFFKDAAIMRPESRSEVTSLLAMMKENPAYKIKIHGHTNGNSAGKIISMGPSKKFFAMSDTKEGFGSAKKLSEERGNVIREFLAAEGIDEKRMEIKAWGGKRPIHEDKFSPQAQANVRVEIEILEDK